MAPRLLTGLGLAGALAVSAEGSAPVLPAKCGAAAIGGGWSGVYYAYRLAMEGVKVCVFEGSQRIGGRTYSHSLEVNGENFTVDVGAYRFTPDMHLPGDIIMKVLKLPTACYEPSCPPANKDFPPPFVFPYKAPLRRIINKEGMPAGYVTAIEGMVEAIKARGGQVFTGARLLDVKLGAVGQPVELIFGEHRVFADRALLNLPRAQVLGLPSLRAATPARTRLMQECVKFDLPDSLFPPSQKLSLGKSLTKAYAFYSDAWWHTKLNKTEGQLPDNAFEPMQTSQGVPIGIHFNDGPVRCESPGKNCRGFLEVFYSTFNETFYQDLRKDPMHPLVVLPKADDRKGHLQRLHSAIMEASAGLWKEAGLETPREPPTLLVEGVWGRDGVGYTAPTKVYYSKSETLPDGPDPLEKACGVPGLTEDEYRSSVMMPLSDLRLLVANNDFCAQETEKLQGDWAEDTLLQVERGLRASGFPRPEWLDEAYYAEKVMAFTPRGPGAAELHV